MACQYRTRVTEGRMKIARFIDNWHHYCIQYESMKPLFDNLDEFKNVKADRKFSYLTSWKIGTDYAIELENKIINKERELTKLERNIIALRSGKVVISSGQSIFIAEIDTDKRLKIDLQMQNIIKNANRLTQKKVIPKVKEPRRILLLRKNHIEELKKTIRNGGKWVINIKSVRNVLEGENYVYAFPELVENKTIVLKDEIISKTSLINTGNNIKDLRNTINLLLASSLAEAKRRGSLINEIKLKSDSVKKLQVYIEKNKGFDFQFEVVSLRDSKTAQPIIVELNVSKLLS